MLNMARATCPHAGVIATGVAVVLYLIVTSCFYVYYEEKPCESASRLSASDYDKATCKEDWTLIDALYFTMVSMSTVGYGDLSPSNPLSKALTMVFVLIGVAVVFYQTSQVLAAASDECERRVIRFFVMMADKRAKDKMSMMGRAATVGNLGQLVDLDGDGVADVVEPPGALMYWTQHYAFNVVVFVMLQLVSAGIFTQVQPDMSFGDAIYLCIVTSTTGMHRRPISPRTGLAGAGTPSVASSPCSCAYSACRRLPDVRPAVGYGDISISTQNARLFSFFHILLSVSWLGAAITQLEPLRGVRRQQLQRMELLKRKLDTELITSLDRDGGPTAGCDLAAAPHPAHPFHALHLTYSPPPPFPAPSPPTLPIPHPPPPPHETRASTASAGNGVNQTEFVVGMLCALGAEMCGEPLVWEDVMPFIRQFQSLDADKSGILSKADLQLIAERQREKLSSNNTKLLQKLEKVPGGRGSQASISIGGGSQSTTPRGSTSRVSPEEEADRAAAPGATPKLAAGGAPPAIAPCCDRVLPMSTEPAAVVTPA